jgi:hypothetical protein
MTKRLPDLGIAAAELAAQGFRVFPALPRGKRPAIKEWPTRATTDSDELRSWWKANPSRNVAIACGRASGLVVLDVDSLAAELELMATHGTDWTRTRTVQTAHGKHFYFLYPATGELRNSTGKIADHVDVRGEGGYVVAPPSLHPNGNRYRWKKGDAELLPAPEWLFATNGVARAAANGDDGGPIFVGERNATLTRIAGGMRRQGAKREEILAALESVNLRCQPPLANAEVTAIAKSVSRYAPAEVEITAPRPVAKPSAAPLESDWPAPLGEAAWHGPAGAMARLLEPASEADPVALLLQLLVALGNLMGHDPCFLVEDTAHTTNLFLCVVGTTSKSRKGTGWGRVRKQVAELDAAWESACIKSGLSSGEGLIEAVADRATVKYGDLAAQIASKEKRLLVLQDEFSSVLKIMQRESNILSAIVRNAWDHGNLNTMTRKTNALHATRAHISIVGHITRDELRRLLTEMEMANGFGNRFLWIIARRSKELPLGGTVVERERTRILKQLRAALDFAAKVGNLKRSAAADHLWIRAYSALSEGSTGMFGAITARGEAQVVRLSCLYALLDCSRIIEPVHLRAALAVWKYCEDSARYIFGNSMGDPVADVIMAALVSAPSGVTRTDIDALFGNHRTARVEQGLRYLLEQSKIHAIEEKTLGRPRTKYFPGPPEKAHSQKAS